MRFVPLHPYINSMNLAKSVLKRICDWSMSMVTMTKWWQEEESLKGVVWAHWLLHLMYTKGDELVGSKEEEEHDD